MTGTGWAQGVGLAAQIIPALARSDQTLATAESLTGGLMAAALTQVAGASAVFRGGVVAYQTELKASLVGVDRELLARDGPVSPAVAEALAEGIRGRLEATWGAATTGVAGPQAVDEHPVGTVFVAVTGPRGCRVRALSLGGSRDQIRQASLVACLRLLAASMALPDADTAAAPGACEAAGTAPDTMG